MNANEGLITSERLCMNAIVRRLKTMVGWVLLLVWLPATSLCLIERAGWLADDECCPSAAPKTTPSKPCSDSVCCTLASATYKADEDQQPHVAAPLVAWVPGIEDLIVDPDPVPVAGHLGDLGPPELRTTWQFTFRTALPPRAPSFI